MSARARDVGPVTRTPEPDAAPVTIMRPSLRMLTTWYYPQHYLSGNSSHRRGLRS
jgi:hypothetical protein